MPCTDNTLLPRSHRWKDVMILEIYDLAHAGMTEKQIKDRMNVASHVWDDWKKKIPLVREVLARARRKSDGTNGLNVLSDYVYNALPKHLKEAWDDLNKIETSKAGLEEVREFLQDYGTVARQHLFLFALTKYNFNPSRAMTRMGMNELELNTWMADKGFAQLIQQVLKHKGNFFEDALVEAVKRGETSAIIFANKTFNKDRGYGEKIEVSGSIQHSHLLINITELDLSIEVRKEILQAVRKKKEKDKVVEGKVARLEHHNGQDTGEFEMEEVGGEEEGEEE